MENILQSLVKIIIIAVLYGKVHVNCNRQFLPPPPPPLPYYQNEDFYVPGFAPAVRDQVPTYYPDRNLPNPTSFQNIKSYTPPRLFYQNENYIPPPVATPGLTYPLSHIPPYKQAFHQPLQPHKPQQKLNFSFSRVQYKNPPQTLPARPQLVPKKKTEAFASNIIVKEEPLTPYYPDDYSKNYNDEDYTDSYSDDGPAAPKPCILNNPYRYFEAPKRTHNSDNKLSLCSPHFQPNFGSGMYTLKVPVTLLPSRFPPRVEQLIERIQNYFSTYTQQQQTVKPHTETSSSSSTPTAVDTSTESAPQSSTVGEANEMTGEIQQEATSAGVTAAPIAVAAETKDWHASAATEPDAQVRIESQTEEASTTPRADDVTETVPDVVTEAAVTVTEPSQHLAGSTPSGTEEPRSPFPEELQSLNNSSSTPADLQKDNQHIGVMHANGSFQPADSNNG